MGSWNFKRPFVAAHEFIASGRVGQSHRSPAARVRAAADRHRAIVRTVAQAIETGAMGGTYFLVTIGALFASIRTAEVTLKLIGRFATVKRPTTEDQRTLTR